VKRRKTFAKPGDTIRILENGACGAMVAAGDEFTVARVTSKGYVAVSGETAWQFWPGTFEVVRRAEKEENK
jgi:predicted RecA/RadA family phage recombinase